MFSSSALAVKKSNFKNNTYYLNKKVFTKNPSKSFDYAVLEKAKEINAIKLDILWSDFGNWREISKFYKRNKKKIF